MQRPRSPRPPGKTRPARRVACTAIVVGALALLLWTTWRIADAGLTRSELDLSDLSPQSAQWVRAILSDREIDRRALRLVQSAFPGLSIDPPPGGNGPFISEARIVGATHTEARPILVIGVYECVPVAQTVHGSWRTFIVDARGGILHHLSLVQPDHVRLDELGRLHISGSPPIPLTLEHCVRDKRLFDWLHNANIVHEARIVLDRVLEKYKSDGIECIRALSQLDQANGVEIINWAQDGALPNALRAYTVHEVQATDIRFDDEWMSDPWECQFRVSLDPAQGHAPAVSEIKVAVSGFHADCPQPTRLIISTPDRRHLR